MNCIDKHLSYIAEKAGKDPAFFITNHRQKASALILGYLFGAFDLSNLQRKFLTVTGIDCPRNLRRNLIADPRVMHNTKFPLYRAIYSYNEGVSPEGCTKNAVLDGMHTEDLEIISLVLCTPVLLKHMLSLVEKGYTPLTIKAFQKECTKAVLDNKNNTTVFVRWKMRFLSLWGVTQSDSIADCEGHAYEALLFHYPMFDNRAHLHNLFKLSIRQSGLKMIAHFKTQRRSVYNASQEYIKDSLDIDPKNIMEIEEAPSCNLFGADSTSEDDILQVRSVLQRPEITESDKQFMALMSGYTPPEFEDWLRDEKGITNVEDVTNRCTSNYQRLVMTYLHYPRSRLSFLRDVLRGDNLMEANPAHVVQEPREIPDVLSMAMLPAIYR